MLFTLTTTHHPATDLGYLLHKNPAKTQTFSLAFGNAYVAYPEATDDRCTAALILDIDPISLVRGRPGSSGDDRTLAQYVNDRPYAASSYLSVAIAQVYASALAGRCKERPDLADSALPFEAFIPVIASRGGEEMVHRMFEPLGYNVVTTRHPLDPTFPEWGESWYYSLRLTATIKLSELLSHVYVLVSALDVNKHYGIGDDEVEKLVRKGEGWLATHPEKQLIVGRYLRNRKSLIRLALEQLTEDEPETEEVEQARDAEELTLERPISLHTQRLDTVAQAIAACGAKSVIDLGCGEGRLLALLLKEKQFTRIVGMDVTYRSLETAQMRLKVDRMSETQKARLTLFQGSLIYRDSRLADFDAAAIVEVIEHLDEPRLAAFERVVFEFARPKSVAITTPNVEYNQRFESLPAVQFRHKDHRFEWTRAQFETWATTICTRFGYTATFSPVGPVDDAVGTPSQMAVFERVA